MKKLILLLVVIILFIGCEDLLLNPFSENSYSYIKLINNSIDNGEDDDGFKDGYYFTYIDDEQWEKQTYPFLFPSSNGEYDYLIAEVASGEHKIEFRRCSVKFEKNDDGKYNGSYLMARGDFLPPQYINVDAGDMISVYAEQ